MPPEKDLRDTDEVEAVGTNDETREIPVLPEQLERLHLIITKTQDNLTQSPADWIQAFAQSAQQYSNSRNEIVKAMHIAIIDQCDNYPSTLIATFRSQLSSSITLKERLTGIVFTTTELRNLQKHGITELLRNRIAQVYLKWLADNWQSSQ